MRRYKLSHRLQVNLAVDQLLTSYSDTSSQISVVGICAISLLEASLLQRYAAVAARPHSLHTGYTTVVAPHISDGAA